ncbi:MAG TPA: serine hydrolase domain-containing protein [Gemmatimonadaceae bacterium]|nr:serine hydrolase domain-containing protein [Gemmatimonadaceae bacterium]
MTRWRTLLVSLGLCIPLGAIGRSQERPAARADALDTTRIDAYITAKMRSARIPGVALAIVQRDRIAYLKGYGRADPSGRPVTPQTPFLIGSITKPFTALAVMQLVDAGRVGLDAPVQRYLPWFHLADSAASARITVRQLLTMTSGIPQLYETQVWTDQDDGALERAVRILQTKKLAHAPGTSVEYSNANYDALGLIVQAVSGRSYEEYVTQHIFAPLAMRNSFASQDEALRHGMASGHRWWFGIPVAVTFPYRRPELPAGYLISGAEDMAHFLIAQMNEGRYRDTAVLSPAGMAVMHAEPPPKHYGMGWESLRANGRRLINHDGGAANFQASVFFDPEARVGVFVAADVISALDAFSSPPGNSRLDGATTRAMAHTVLSMAMGEPVPSQGVGIEMLTVAFDLTILALTVVLLLSLMRMRGWYRRLVGRGVENRAEAVSESAEVAVRNFVVPAAALYLTVAVPAWDALVIFQPDLEYWVNAVAIVLFLKGVVELALVWKVSGHAGRHLVVGGEARE